MLTNSFKAITTSIELIEKHAKAKAFNEIMAEITKLQKACFEAYSLAFSLHEKYGELKKKHLETKDWENKTVPDYTLTQIAPGVFVYAFKPGEKRDEPPHYLCTNCFKDKRKSILQRAGRDVSGVKYNCPECGTDILDHTDCEEFNIATSGRLQSADIFRGY